MSVPFARDGMSVPFARDGMSVPFTRRDDIMACPLLTVRTERRGGSAATDADVEVRHDLFTLAPGAPFFDVSLPPSSVGFAQNERNPWCRRSRVPFALRRDERAVHPETG